MTDGPVRVMPREPLVAVWGPTIEWNRKAPFLIRDDDGPSAYDVKWADGSDVAVCYDDAEFAAHFVPADAYERLMGAVGAWVDALDDDRGDYGEFCQDTLIAAYRAYVGGDT